MIDAHENSQQLNERNEEENNNIMSRYDHKIETSEK